MSQSDDISLTERAETEKLSQSDDISLMERAETEKRSMNDDISLTEKAETENCPRATIFHLRREQKLKTVPERRYFTYGKSRN